MKNPELRAFHDALSTAIPWAASQFADTETLVPILHLDLRYRPDIAAVLNAESTAARRGESLEANALTTWRFGTGPDGSPLFLLEITLRDDRRKQRVAPFTLAFRRDNDMERRLVAVIALEQQMLLSAEPPVEEQERDVGGMSVSVTSDLIGALYKQAAWDALPELFPWRNLPPGEHAAYPPQWLPVDHIAISKPQTFRLAGVAQPGSTALGLVLAPTMKPNEARSYVSDNALVWTLTPGDDGSRSVYVLEVMPDGRLLLKWGLTFSARQGVDPTEELARLWERPMRYGVPTIVLFVAIFLARTYASPLPIVWDWLPSLLSVQDHVQQLIDTETPEATRILRGLLRHYRSTKASLAPVQLLENVLGWGSALQRPSPHLADLFDTPERTQVAAALAVVYAWGGELPRLHPATGLLAPLDAVLTRVDRALAATYLPESAAWLYQPNAPIWLVPDMRGAVAAGYDPAQLALLRQVAAELVREAHTGLPPVGRYRVRLPVAGLSELHRYGVSTLEINAHDDGGRWLRIAPSDGEADGIIIPWSLAPEPPAQWHNGVLPPRLLWELHLTLCAWERDMRREPAVRLRFVVPTEPVARTSTTKQRGRNIPGVHMLPREQVRRVHLGPPPAEGDYAGDEEPVMERTLAAYHRVRDHAVHFRATRRASPAQRERFLKLPLAYRLARYQIAELPPEGMTIRGLADGPDGVVVRGYSRGALADGANEQPRQVVAQGLLAVRAALKVVTELETSLETSERA